jgi:hypothetical protein
MTDHQVKSWFGASVQAVASHPAVQALAMKWLQIKTERDPCLADFWHNPDEAFTNNTILFLKGERDFTYLHHGRYLRDRIGFSMQGLQLGALRTKVRGALMEIYDRSSAGMELAYFQSFADFQQDVVLWGRLCLPLRISEDDPRVAILLYCHPIEDKASIARTVFERSSIGIIIATPIKDDGGRIEDAWVVAQNEHAGEVTGIEDHASADLLLRHTPLFGREEVWEHLTRGLEQHATVAVVTDKVRNLTLNLSLELLGEYLVARIMPVERPREFVIE